MARSSGTGSAALTIRLLGPVDIRVDGVPLAVDTRKAVALLAYVAVAGRPTPREALATLLWPDSKIGVVACFVFTRSAGRSRS